MANNITNKIYCVVSLLVSRIDQHEENARGYEKNGTPNCGNCTKWMKSSQCPRERNVNGFNRGPSCNSPICTYYDERSSAQDWRNLAASEREKAEALRIKL